MLKKYSKEVLAEAVALLKQGEIVAIPTETVYGLAANAANPLAVAKIFAAKGRPANHPLIVHLADINLLSQWAKIQNPFIEKLASHFWPGPLTLILPRQPGVSDVVTGGQETIGIRFPSHPIMREILLELGGAVAAPSANTFARISPTLAEHVDEDLGAVIPLIVDGGQCSIGIESTIVDLSGEKVRILRPGIITPHEISAVLGVSVEIENPGSLRVSGALYSHYAPKTSLQVIEADQLKSKIQDQIKMGHSIAVLAYSQPFENDPLVEWNRLTFDPNIYAHELYAVLHQMDNKSHAMLYVEALPDEEKWAAIRDRLKKAAH